MYCYLVDVKIIGRSRQQLAVEVTEKVRANWEKREFFGLLSKALSISEKEMIIHKLEEMHGK